MTIPASLLLCVLGITTGCAGAFGSAIQASVRAGLRENYAMHERCERIMGRAPGGGGESLAMVGPLSLGDPRDLLAQLEAIVTGGIRTGAASAAATQNDLGAEISRMVDALSHDGDVGAWCRGDDPRVHERGTLPASVAAVCDDLRRLASDTTAALEDARTLFRAVQARAQSIATSCGASVADVQRPSGTAEVGLSGTLRCGVAVIDAFGAAMSDDIRPRVERAVRLFESLPARIESVHEHVVDLSSALERAARSSVADGPLGAQTLTRGVLTRVGRRVDDALAMARGGASFLSQGLPMLQALARGDLAGLARTILDRGLFDSAAEALLHAIEPELRRVDRVIDRLDDATYGLITVSTMLLSPQISQGLQAAVGGIEDVLERAHVPVIAFVRTSCRAMESRRTELAASRVIPRLYRAIVDAWYVRHPATGERASARRGAGREGAPESGGGTGTGTATGAGTGTGMRGSEGLATFAAHVRGDILARTLVASAQPGRAIDEGLVRALGPALGAQVAAHDEHGALDTRANTETPSTIEVARSVADSVRGTPSAALVPIDAVAAAIGGTGSGSGAPVASLAARVSDVAEATVRQPPSVIAAVAPASPNATVDVRNMIDAQRGAAEQMRSTLHTQTQILRALADGAAGTPENRFCASLTGSVACQPSSGGAFGVEVEPLFPNAQWSAEDVQDAVVGVARTARRFGLELDAEVHGFASSRAPSCRVVLAWHEGRGVGAFAPAAPALPHGVRRVADLPPAIEVRVGDRAQTLICDDTTTDGHGDGNDALSLLRAAWAARLLEGSSAGALRVVSVRAFGADFAASRNDRRDRSIRIVFWRRGSPAVRDAR